MPRQIIDLDTQQPDGKRGEPVRSAFGKANDNFEEVYALAKDGTAAKYWADVSSQSADVAMSATNLRGSVSEALADTTIANGQRFTVYDGDGFQAYLKVDSTTATPYGPKFPTLDSVQALKDLAFTSGKTDDLEQHADINDVIYLRIDKDGKIYMVDLDGALQDRINEVSGSIYRGMALFDSDIFAVADDDGQLVARIDKDGKLFVVGLEDSIQDSIGVLSSVDTTIAAERTGWHVFSVEAAAAITTRMQNQTGQYAPAPIVLLQGNLSFSTDIRNAFTVAQPADRLVIDSPYFPDDEFVHPNLIEFYNGFRGYRYWLTINPYRSTNDFYENPVVYGTNDPDFKIWTPIPGIDFPLAPNPGDGYLADNFWAYDPLTGELIDGFIRYTVSTDTTEGQYRATKDGTNFTPIRNVFPPTPMNTESMVSPALFYNPKTGLWHLYTQGTTGSFSNVPRRLRVRFSRHREGPWSDPTEIPTDYPYRPWHQDLRYIAGKFVILCSNTYVGNMFLGVSDDGINFTFGDQPILTDNDPCYKGTFLPVWDGDKLALRLMWTTAVGHPDHPETNRWNVYTAQTNFIDIT